MSFSLIEIDPVHRIYSGHFSSFPEDIAVHGVSCRRGGVSKSPWDSLDLGLHVGDDPANVAENVSAAAMPAAALFLMRTPSPRRMR